ncbi:MAG TPA: sigma-54 dependent transcriptional regulator [Elusimicrobiota bacterium]|nr:sigma-54 dependent transcriptional regulator [Elusimicrobiota bacterium]
MTQAKPAKILVVDDEPNVGMIFHRVLGELGYDVVSAANGMECLRVLKKQEPDVVFLDLRMPGMDGVETLRRLRETHPHLPVLIMTAYQTVTSAVECMKLGAYDYLIKPLDTEHLKSIVKQALALGEISQRTPAARQTAAKETPLVQDVVAEGPEMKRALALVEKVAPTDLTVLILGESGTGKEVIAREIHQRSPRRSQPFIVVDCAALPESLIESELFGYEKGAFTGADTSKPGKFESAQNGTLFLDEIGNLPLAIQAKLLRFLQEPTIERLGGRKGPLTLNVRIVAATNADLDAAVARGTFREDLFHRLKVFLLQLPPLRERGPEDLKALVNRIVTSFGRQFGKTGLSLAPETLELLEHYRWPGNIRELQNALRSAALLADNVILPTHVPISIQSHSKPVPSPKENVMLNDIVQKVEKEYILTNLQRFQGDKLRVAEALGMDVATLSKKLKEYGIE